ncbi:MAG: phosphoglycerate dehydrogenase [Thermodesulfobacteriota bacterium]
MNDGKAERKNLKDCKVLVTPTSFGKDDPRLKPALEESVGSVVYNPLARPLISAELLPLVGDIDAYIAGLDSIDRSVIEAAQGLRVIARYGVGVDRVDIPAATARGIVVTNTPGANSVAVAELTIALMLALARDLCRADTATRRGEWPRLSGVGLRGKTVGLVGFGSIGREVASRLKAFGCRVLTSDPFVQAETAEACGARLVSLDELLPAADFVSLHASLHPTTVGMVDEGFLENMKPGAFLVNTARGELIDEAALARALEEGRMGGVALDCFSREPLPADHPLLRFPKVLVTPHTASHTDEATNAMGWMSLEACLAVLRGERSPYTINPGAYET